jgi:prephenate dehydrogenase
VSVVGVGLIGGSIGKALRTRGIASRVVGVGRSQANLAEAFQVGAIDEATTSLRVGVADADVVVICTPVTEIVEGVCQVARDAPSGVLVTDAGSTKRAIVEAVERDPEAREVFVGAHPIAGSERKGAIHSDANLFQGRACVLTPTEQTPPDRLERALAFWAGLGCRIVTLSPSAHDDALVLTSHLPHAVAAALAATVPPRFLSLAAGAYRDGTRVAASDASLWTGIFLSNRVPLLDALGRFENELATFRAALEQEDEARLQSWWESARNQRAAFDPGAGGSIQH